MLHVDADLVGAAGLQLTLHYSYVGKVLDGVPVSDGMLSLVAVGKDLHQDTVTRVAPDVTCNGAVFLFHLAPHDSDVLSLGGFFEELGTEGSLGVGRLGDDQQTTGVFVDAMDEAQAGVGHVIVRVVLEVPGEGIDQCAVKVAVTGMHHHACGLIDDHQAGIFIDDIQGDVLGDDFALISYITGHLYVNLQTLRIPLIRLPNP